MAQITGTYEALGVIHLEELYIDFGLHFSAKIPAAITMVIANIDDVWQISTSGNRFSHSVFKFGEQYEDFIDDIESSASQSITTLEGNILETRTCGLHLSYEIRMLRSYDFIQKGCLLTLQNVITGVEAVRTFVRVSNSDAA